MDVKRQEELEMDAVVAETAVQSELGEPRWSVVSFSRSEAERLTYAQAVELMSELDSNGVAGLCIVTAEAATRISR